MTRYERLREPRPSFGQSITAFTGQAATLAPKSPFRRSDPGPKLPLPPQRTNGYVIAYDGPSWEYVGKRLNENAEWYHHDYMTYGPEMICILTKGFVYKNDLHVFYPSPGLEHLDVVHVQNMPGLKEIVYQIEECLHRYGALTYELGRYH